MGGRIAEEILLGKSRVTGGASNDMFQATRIAEAMVQELGMSEKVGLRVFSAETLRENQVSDPTKALLGMQKILEALKSNSLKMFNCQF